MKTFFVIMLFGIFAVSCGNKKVVSSDHAYYTCLMHPQVMSHKPGKCPICGMPLTLVQKTQKKKNTEDLELSDQQMQLGNIVVDTISRGRIGGEIELTGTLNLNASRLASVSARLMGRIERLYVKSTGEYVAKGSPLYDLYSEELNNAKQEYVAAIERKTLFRDQSFINFDELVANARTKLILWGMTDAQIEGLEKSRRAPVTTTFYSPQSGYVTSLDASEGSYVMDGASIIQLADLSTLWADAQVHTTQFYQIPRNAQATVIIEGSDKKISGRVEFVNPEVEMQTGINLLRVLVPNPALQLKPGMSVRVRIRDADQKTGLSLPTDAVIRSPNGATVWVQTGKNRFRSRMVVTGVENEGLSEIVSGLNEGEAVVVQGTYLLNSEYIFKRGTDPMAGHNH